MKSRGSNVNEPIDPVLMEVYQEDDFLREAIFKLPRHSEQKNNPAKRSPVNKQLLEWLRQHGD